MKFKIFTLHPDIFTSFISNSLIARAIFKQIIEIKTIDWRQDFGIGNYKQVDDKPFGGGSGMVLMAAPIINAMIREDCFDSEKLKVRSEKLGKDTTSNDCHSERLSEESPADEFQNITDNYPVASQQLLDRGNKLNKLIKPEAGNSPLEGWQSQTDGLVKGDATDSGELKFPSTNNPILNHNSLLPNNANFYQQIKSGQLITKKVNILMTPRGFPMTQQVVEWLANDFDQINILCGRYEGFDARINDHIDLELSIGNFVLNGGEVGSMCLIEAVSRLVPDFITKNTSVLHDSFSSGLNNYNEFQFENSKPHYQRELEKSKNSEKLTKNSNFRSNIKLPLNKGLAAQAVWGYKSDETNKPNTKQINTNQPLNLFNNTNWLQNILPQIEHPQYTRPNIWQDPITGEQKKVPEVLLEGNHAKIQKWRVRWW
jgi:tRNA G37 N-methylase TrmD